MSPTKPAPAVASGMAFALLASASFASSGPIAKSLIMMGWTPGATVLVRLTGAAVVLVAIVAVRHGMKAWPTGRAAGLVVVYGVLTMAGLQFAFFNAIRTLDVGVALLLQFTAPVLLLAWTSIIGRKLPRAGTLTGAAVTMVGVMMVLDIFGGVGLDPSGVVWGLTAAVLMSAFYVLSHGGRTAVPPLILAAGGTAVGALTMGLLGAIGLVPMNFTDATVTLRGSDISWYWAAAALIAIATVLAYWASIASIVRLGSRIASFVGLTEVVASVLAAWVLLGELPRTIQLIGGGVIIAGIVLIQRHESRTVAITKSVSVDPTAPGRKDRSRTEK